MSGEVRSRQAPLEPEGTPKPSGVPQPKQGTLAGARNVKTSQAASPKTTEKKSSFFGGIFKKKGEVPKSSKVIADGLRKEIALLKVGIAKSKIGETGVEKADKNIEQRQAHLDKLKTKEGIFEAVGHLKEACAQLKKSKNAADRKEAEHLERDLETVVSKLRERMESPIYHEVEELKNRVKAAVTLEDMDGLQTNLVQLFDKNLALKKGDQPSQIAGTLDSIRHMIQDKFKNQVSQVLKNSRSDVEKEIGRRLMNADNRNLLVGIKEDIESLWLRGEGRPRVLNKLYHMAHWKEFQIWQPIPKEIFQASQKSFMEKFDAAFHQVLDAASELETKDRLNLGELLKRRLDSQIDVNKLSDYQGSIEDGLPDQAVTIIENCLKEYGITESKYVLIDITKYPRLHRAMADMVYFYHNLLWHDQKKNVSGRRMKGEAPQKHEAAVKAKQAEPHEVANFRLSIRGLKEAIQAAGQNNVEKGLLKDLDRLEKTDNKEEAKTILLSLKKIIGDNVPAVQGAYNAAVMVYARRWGENL